MSNQPPPPPGTPPSSGQPVPPPPPSLGAPQVPPPEWYAHGWNAYPAGQFEAPRPRPRVTAGAVLIIVGGVLAVIGVFLPWVSLAGQSFNGFDDYVTSDGSLLEMPGAAVIFGALATAGLGIALAAAGRVLAVAIIAIVTSSLGVTMGIVYLILMDDVVSWNAATMGIGVYLQPLAAGACLAGSIMATAKRR